MKEDAGRYADEEYFEPKVMVCVRCGEEFIFAVGEQKFYLSKQLSDPKRYQPCRIARRKLINREVRDG